MSCQHYGVIGNFMKRLCTCKLLQWIFLDQKSFVTKQKSKFNLYFNFIFVSIERNILKYSKFFEENPGTNQNFLAHVL